MALRFFDAMYGYGSGGSAVMGAGAGYSYVAPPVSTVAAGRFSGQAYAHLPGYAGGGYVFTPFTISGTVVRFAVDNQYMTSGAFLVGAVTNGASTGVDSPTVSANNANTFFVVARNSSGKFEVRKGASQIAQGTNVYNSTSSFYRIEVEADVQVSGRIRVWVNNNLEIDYSGDLVGSVTGVPSLFQDVGENYRRSFLAIWDDSGTGGFSGYLGDFRPVQLLPNGVGSSSQSTVTGAATRHQAVDDIFRNGLTDYISLAGNGHKDLYTYSDVGITGPVISVVAQPSASLGGTGQARVKAECLSGATTASSAQSGLLGTLVNAYGDITLTHEFPVDPNTGVAWTVSGIDAAEFGVSAVLGS